MCNSTVEAPCATAQGTHSLSIHLTETFCIARTSHAFEEHAVPGNTLCAQPPAPTLLRPPPRIAQFPALAPLHAASPYPSVAANCDPLTHRQPWPLRAPQLPCRGLPRPWGQPLPFAAAPNTTRSFRPHHRVSEVTQVVSPEIQLKMCRRTIFTFILGSMRLNMGAFLSMSGMMTSLHAHAQCALHASRLKLPQHVTVA